MIIRSITVSGFQAFAPDTPARFMELSSKNVFIGPNNSGKSTVFRLLSLVKLVLEHTQKIGQVIDIPTTLPSSYWWKHQSDSVGTSAMIFCELSDSDLLLLEKIPAAPDWRFPDSKDVGFRIELLPDSKMVVSLLFLIGDDLLPDYMHNLPKPHLDKKGDYCENSCRADTQNRVDAFFNLFKSQLRFFDAVRSLSRPSGSTVRVEDGSGVLKELLIWSKDGARHNRWVQFRKSVVHEINKLLVLTGSPKMSDFEIVGDESDPRMHVIINDISLELSLLGSGLAELILIMIAIARDKNEPRIYFLEEPESHLHPGLLRRFIEQLNQYQNIQFFINTHSNVILDSLEPGDRIFQLMQDDEGRALAKNCSDIVQLHDVIDALGLRASSLLQSNCALWIEGPSDRLYIREMLSQYAKGHGQKLIEGSDYSFVMYGGKNLTHFDFELAGADDLTDLIAMLKVSRYSAVLMDRDLAPSEPDSIMRSAKKRIIEQAAEDPKRRAAFITQGREIELDIPTKVLLNALRSVLKVNYERLDDSFEFKQTVSFAREVAVHLSQGNEAREDTLVKRILAHKVPLARVAVSHCRGLPDGLGPYPPWLDRLYKFIMDARSI